MVEIEACEETGLPQLSTLARQISVGAAGRPIGELQARRTARKELSRVPNLFDGRSIRKEWAFHVGGLAELQFNIGFECIDGERLFRHGVAFSLQENRNVPDIRVFDSRIEKFNRFLDENPKAYRDLSMWHFIDGKRSANFAPRPIVGSVVRQRVFIMLGATCPVDAIDIGTVLDDFDRLMPLYEHVEGQRHPAAGQMRKARKFQWSPGNKARAPRARYERVERNIDVELRHNKLQAALFAYLESVYGSDHVSGEQDCGDGTCIDVAVRNGSRYIYYEIKTGCSARSCLRQAFGQLMEYAYWPIGQGIESLVVVGEPPLDAEAMAYLKILRRKFRLPLEYRQFDARRGRLVPSEFG